MQSKKHGFAENCGLTFPERRLIDRQDEQGMLLCPNMCRTTSRSATA
jgi:hypothetical protein